MNIKEVNKLRLKMGLPMYFGETTDKEMAELLELNKIINHTKFWKNTNPPNKEECIEILEGTMNDYEMLYNRLEQVEVREQDLYTDLVEDLALCHSRIKAFSERLKEITKDEEEYEEDEVLFVDKLLEWLMFWDKTPTEQQIEKAKRLKKKVVGRQKIKWEK
jgi:hypothetical protein